MIDRIKSLIEFCCVNTLQNYKKLDTKIEIERGFIFSKIKTTFEPNPDFNYDFMTFIKDEFLSNYYVEQVNDVDGPKVKVVWKDKSFEVGLDLTVDKMYEHLIKDFGLPLIKEIRY